MNHKSKKGKAKKISNKNSSFEKHLTQHSPDDESIRVESSFDMSKLNAFANYLEKMHFEEYINYRLKPWRIIRINLFAGMAKGLGFAIGFTVLAFIAFYILRKLQVLELPFLGNFIADLLEYIDEARGINPY